MFRFLFVLVFMFAILMFLMGFSVFRTFKNILFGSGEKKTQQRKQTGSNNSRQRQNRNNPPPQQKKKIFTKEEGEYVDYEEVD